MFLRVHAAMLPALWATAIGIRSLNVISYLPGKLCDLARREKFYMHFTMLGFAPDSISCISVTTYLFVHLAGDQTWTMPLGEVCFESCVTWLSLRRHIPLGVLVAAQPIPRLGGWRRRRQTMWRIFSDSADTYATRYTFGGSSSSYAQGLDATRHSAYLRQLVQLSCSGAERNRAFSMLSAARLASILRAGRRKQFGVHYAEAERFFRDKIYFEW
jgi:hypothetical protein